MKYLIYILLLVNFPCHAFVASQEALNGISSVRGFLVGQQEWLKLVGSQYPEFANEVKVVKMEFDLAYPNAIEKVEKIAKEVFGEEISKSFLETDIQIKDQVSKVNITKDSALNFLKLVQNRSAGNIERENIKKYLNAVIFYDNPHQEFVKSTVNFDFSGSEKSKGLDVVLQMPLSWQAVDSNFPNTLKMWKSEVGTGLGYNTLEIRKFDGEGVSEKNVLESVKRGVVPRGIVPKDYIKSKIQYIKHSRLPGVLFDIEYRINRLQNELFIMATNLVLYDDDKVLILSCGVGDLAKNGSSTKDKFLKNSSLCQTFFNSLIIKNKF